MDELLAKTGYQLSVPKRGDVIKGMVTEVKKRMVLAIGLFAILTRPMRGKIEKFDRQVADDLVAAFRK